MTTTIAFFNNKGGVGKTSLVYHLAWMIADLGYRVLAADLDPQATLSTLFLDEGELERRLEPGPHARTIHQAVAPLTGVGDIAPVELFSAGPGLCLLPGDIQLSIFEDALSASWTDCLGSQSGPFYVITAFDRIIGDSAAEMNAHVVLIDVGPNLGAINRSALLAADWIVFPVGADLFSLYGLKNLGPRLDEWREEWARRSEHFAQRHAGLELRLPAGTMRPAGYIATQHAQYAGRASKAYRGWLHRIPETYLRHVCRDQTSAVPALDEDPHCLARLKHYRSLMPMAHEARKPIFHLTPADGAIGAHTYAARACRDDFEALAQALFRTCGLE